MSAFHLADILNSNLESYRQHHTMSYQQLRVCRHLQSCRTGQLGYQAWQTLSKFAKRKRHGRLSMTSVLHTWGQNLSQHIHLHCLIPAGALDKARWHEIEKGYLYPVKALSTVFRGKMLAALNESDSSFAKISTPTKWCVYSKACLTYNEKLVSYLARYTRKGVMSESRLVSANEQSVSFKYHDYADNNRDKVMTLSCDEFLRRYLQHS